MRFGGSRWLCDGFGEAGKSLQGPNRLTRALRQEFQANDPWNEDPVVLP